MGTRSGRHFAKWPKNLIGSVTCDKQSICQIILPVATISETQISTAAHRGCVTCVGAHDWSRMLPLDWTFPLLLDYCSNSPSSSPPVALLDSPMNALSLAELIWGRVQPLPASVCLSLSVTTAS